MKQLNDFILERLKLNKDTKVSENIRIKFGGKIDFTQKEIDIVQKYAEQLKVKPLILTNYMLVGQDGLFPYKQYIFMYYDKSWENNQEQDTYLYLLKDDEENNKWYANIVINSQNYTLMNNNKKVSSFNVEDVCKELLQQLDKNDMFYNNVKNN